MPSLLPKGLASLPVRFAYLIAGVVIGPIIGHLVGEETTTIQHFAEFGAVMMLFLVGLWAWAEDALGNEKTA